MVYPEVQTPLRELCATREISISLIKLLEGRNLLKVYISQTHTELIKAISPGFLNFAGLLQTIQELIAKQKMS